MPLRYVEPEVAFVVTDPENMEWIIYHVYKNNMIDERHRFWYTTCSKDVWMSHESEDNEFDIRDVLFGPSNINSVMTPSQRVGVNRHHLALQMALSRGLISFEHGVLKQQRRAR